jgi:cation diffusion facilitator family transporter
VPARIRTSSSRDVRLRAARISLAAGVAIFAAKVVAWQLTGSAAVYSDALESIVNVVAASLLVLSLTVALRPADADHPYGHGKAEFLSAGVEGSLILAAALLIAIEAVGDLIAGPSLSRLDQGLAILAAAGAANAVLGVYLVRTGRRSGSLALVADGKHILTDVWTSVGVLVGIGVVWATGTLWLDPLIALLVAAHIVREGVKLVRHAVGGLMDEAEPHRIARLASALEAARRPDWIDVHELRTWRAGRLRHADLHLVVPRYRDADALHAIHEEVARTIRDADEGPAEVVVHFDPCRPHFCAACVVDPCPVREAPLHEQPPITPERATRRLSPPEEP